MLNSRHWYPFWDGMNPLKSLSLGKDSIMKSKRVLPITLPVMKDGTNLSSYASGLTIAFVLNAPISKPYAAPQGQSTASGTQPGPMVLSTPDKSKKRAPLTEAEKKRCCDNHLWLYCGQPGHWASNCPPVITLRVQSGLQIQYNLTALYAKPRV